MVVEDKIRSLMRKFDIRCPNCGSDCLSIEKEVDTDVGILDEIICSDCNYTGLMASSVSTWFVQTN